MLNLFDYLINIKETYTDEYGIVRTRSKYLERARYVLYRQRIFKPPPKLIIDSKDLPEFKQEDLPQKALNDPSYMIKYKNLLISEAVKYMFMMINKEIYDEFKSIKFEVV